MWIPLRLDPEERKLLHLLEGALAVSEYTDKVDVLSYASKVTLILEEIQEFMRTQLGLQLSNNYKVGQRAVTNSLKDNLELFAQAFEVGRRHKIMNPQKMRGGYGKMVFLLQVTLTFFSPIHPSVHPSIHPLHLPLHQPLNVAIAPLQDSQRPEVRNSQLGRKLLFHI